MTRQPDTNEAGRGLLKRLADLVTGRTRRRVRRARREAKAEAMRREMRKLLEEAARKAAKETAAEMRRKSEPPLVSTIVDEGEATVLEIGNNVVLSGMIKGRRNRIVIGDARTPSTLKIHVNGDDNLIEIGTGIIAKQTVISIGNRITANRARVVIGPMTSFEPDCRILAYNHGNCVTIGGSCLISNGIIIRAGEAPHLIFDKATGEYLDQSDGIFIGDHVWLGERCYITKRASVPSDSIVAACAVVTRRFETSNVALGGNPARVVRENVRWVRNTSYFEEGTPYRESHDRYQASWKSPD